MELQIVCVLLQVIAILDRLKNERESAERHDAELSEPSNKSEENGDSGNDDPDEGIIYVK